MENLFYVYEWYIVDTNEVIYVGKGTKNRYKVKKHNNIFNRMIKDNNCNSRIIKYFDNENDAFIYEEKHIKELQKNGQCICNIYNGGYGGTVSWWNEEKREWYSNNNIMKTQKQKDRMSKNNPMKNKDVAKKVNSQKKRPVIINDKIYKSVKDVCDEYNVSLSTVSGWCVNGYTSDGKKCSYLDSIDAQPYVCKNNGQKRRVIYKGNVYDSATSLSKEIGFSQTTVSRWCRNGRDSFGNECRYEDDDRTTIMQTNMSHIPISINGKWYASKSEASRDLGISTYEITLYLDGKKYNEKYICEYGNQQPSCNSTNNNITEGSETNE